jgi:hypothetical protein
MSKRLAVEHKTNRVKYWTRKSFICLPYVSTRALACPPVNKVSLGLVHLLCSYRKWRVVADKLVARAAEWGTSVSMSDSDQVEISMADALAEVKLLVYKIDTVTQVRILSTRLAPPLHVGACS